jgi:hypothetical protein
MTVTVTNTGDEVFEDGFSGLKYRFLPGKAVEIPEAAAMHIFGYECEDKTPHLARLGWAETRNDVPAGLERLAKFEIRDTPLVIPGGGASTPSRHKAGVGKAAAA